MAIYYHHYYHHYKLGLIDIVLQDIDMRQNVGLCTSPHYKHALQCNADEKLELGPYLVIK